MKIICLLLTVIFLTLAVGSVKVFAQTGKTVSIKSLVPAEAKDASGFVSQGWTLAEDELKTQTGDLNGDSIPDYLLVLVRDKSADETVEQAQVLVIALGSKNGMLSRAGVADHLLPCASCYGQIGEGYIGIEKGTILVENSAGNSGNTLSKSSYRFRFEPATKKFLLIGSDFLNNCPSTTIMNVNEESTNFLTGVRKTTRPNGKRTVTKTTKVQKTKTYFDDIDGDKLGEEGNNRILCSF
jgi:hypothetical protein